VGVLRHRLLLGPVLIAAIILLTWLDQVLESRVGLPALLLLPRRPVASGSSA